MSQESNSSSSAERAARSSIAEFEAALRGLQFGSVTAIVQDGVVVQIDRTEKVRFRNPPRADVKSEAPRAFSESANGDLK